MLPETACEEWLACLDRCLADVFHRQSIIDPPVDALQMAAGLKMDVAWDASQAGRARIVKLGGAARGAGRQAVLVRPEPRPERIQWAVAHEIGELLAHRVFSELGVDPRDVSPSAREQAANQLAVRLLLPQAWFLADGEACHWDLASLKARYSTARHELIARRMLDFSEPAVITIFDQGRLTFRRGALGRRAAPLTPLERVCWDQVRATHQFTRLNDRETTVRGWPIHEAEWQREILRMDGYED